LIPTNIDSNTKKYKEMNRVHQLFNDGSTVPKVFVTVGRQRVKQYGNTVYLNNGNEFEIELFNPTTNKVLAKIELNGVSLGAGIVLRPGERVFLERYLNEAKRFLFETYEVDGSNPGVQKAIANNGQVSVKFYNEYISYQYSTITYTGGSVWPSWGNPTYTTYGASLHNMSSPISGLIKTAGLGNSVYSCSANFASGQGNTEPAGVEMESMSFAAPAAAPIETGRIEKGSNSDQAFTYDNTTFNTWWSWSSEWKILPLSQKPFVQEDLKVYCTTCGRKQKKLTEKFCSACGTKY